jgi:cysteine synthase
VSTEEAQRMAKLLAKEEGLLVGISSGAALAVALQVAKEVRAGVIVTIFPDSAHKYFDQKFWSENNHGA